MCCPLKGSACLSGNTCCPDYAPSCFADKKTCGVGKIGTFEVKI